MQISRREFLAALGAFGLASCARPKILDSGLFRGGPEGFSVAALNDLHLTDARSTAFLARVVAQVNAVPDLRFTAVLGDVSSSARLQEFQLAKSCLDRLTKPYYVIPGNHDIAAGENPYGNFRRTFGENRWRIDEDGWTFIGMDSCEGGGSDVTVGPDQIEWLRRVLKHVGGDRPLVLFTHHPLNPHTKEYRVKNAGEILGMFEGYNLKLVASGHYHGNQEETVNGVQFTTTICCTRTRNNFDGNEARGFRLIEIDKAELTTRVVECK